MPGIKLTEQLAYIIASVNRQLEEELQERLRPAGLPIEQFRILEVLDSAGPLPMGELAGQALIEPSTLTKIIDRMVSESLVYRIPDPSDRRRVLIPLAPAGKVLYKRLRNITAAQGQRLEKQLRQGKVEVLRNLLRELMDS